MLEKKTFIDLVSVLLEAGSIEIREANVVLEDGVEISRKCHRYTVAKGDNLIAHDPRIQAIAAAAWGA